MLQTMRPPKLDQMVFMCLDSRRQAHRASTTSNWRPNHYPIWFRQQRILLDEPQPVQFNSVSWAGGGAYSASPRNVAIDESTIVCSFTEGMERIRVISKILKETRTVLRIHTWLNTISRWVWTVWENCGGSGNYSSISHRNSTLATQHSLL